MSVTTCWLIVTTARYILVGVLFYIAYLMGKNHIDYMGWVIFIGVMIALLGGYNLKKEDLATCPKCGHSFTIKVGEDKDNLKIQQQ